MNGSAFLGENLIMNKRVVVAALALVAISAFAQETVKETFLWDGVNEYRGKVETGSPDSTAGYWYEYNDKNYEGSSFFTWPNDVKANAYGDFFGPLTEAYNGIKGSVTLGAGYEYPYAGLAFNVWNADGKGADITAWKGVCLSYESTIGFSIEIAPENEKEVTGYGNYKAPVAKAPCSGVIQDYAWDKFKQEEWGIADGRSIAVDRDVVLKTAATIRLEFEATAGTSGDFLIWQIGSLGECTRSLGWCGISYDSSVKAEAASSVKTRLVGRMLSFEGIALAKAEVIDLQGHVVKSATISSTMDLSSLDAGIYMVRVAGKNVNFAQKIVLK